MLHRLKLKEIDIGEYEADFQTIAVYHAPVKVRDLFPGTATPCSIYLPAFSGTGKRLVLDEFLPKDCLCDQSLCTRLLEEGVTEAYIRKEDEEIFFNYFNRNVQKVIRSPGAPLEKKTALLYDNAENIIKKIFRERPTRLNIGLGQRFVENFTSHIALDKISAEAMLSLFSKDYYTFTHCVQVGVLGIFFCRFLGWGALPDFTIT